MASKALARRPEDPEELALFKALVAPPDTPDAQIKLALQYARNLGLDPLRKQVMIIETTSQGKKNYQIVLSIHAMGALAARQPDYAGINSAAVYEGERITIDARGMVEHTYDPTKRSGAIQGAWATVYRMLHGHRVMHTIWLPYQNYKRQTMTWDRQGAWMIEKTARAFALRAAYPEVLANVYAPEEFGDRSPEKAEDGALARAAKLAENPFQPAPEATTPQGPLPWEVPATETPNVQSVPICGTCGSETEVVTGKGGKLWRQCSFARNEFLAKGDKDIKNSHYLKEETA